jgi:hypothetical protein
MATDEELQDTYMVAFHAAVRRVDDMNAGYGPGLRAVYNAGLARAVEIARSHPKPRGTDPFSSMTSLQDAVAAAIEAERGGD